MKYFNSLPKVIYNDKNNIKTSYTNLMARASVIPSLLNNLLVFYQYDIRDEDTPEIVAYKYYGDMDRFWIVLYCNQMMDPQWDWPLSSRKFEKYVLEKYNNTLDNTHHYEEVTTITNASGVVLSKDTRTLSEDDYNTLPYNYTNSYELNGESFNVNITRNAVTNYNYEINLNESKRNIKILNKDYAPQLERELSSLMK